jgi:hypothetical protein
MASDASPQPTSSSTPTQLEFTRLGNVRVQAVFDEPELSSDGGALLLREAAEVNGILDAMAGAIRDGRDQMHVRHTLKELLTQRTVQICHGYEDANDCDTMREDAVLKVAAGRGPNDGALASQPTMTRLENSVGMRDLIRLFYAFVDNFLDSYASAIANQFRLFLHSAAYVVMHGLRDTALRGTELATATFETIRLRLLKVAARVEAGKTFVRLHLSARCPAAPMFARIAGIASAVRVT